MLLKRARFKNRRCLYVYTVILIVCIYSFIKISHSPKQSKPYVKQITSGAFKTKSVKRILIWKPFMSDTVLEEETNCLKYCDAKCTVSDNKDDVGESDAVYFQLTELWLSNRIIGSRDTIKFPTYRRSDQIWAVLNMEPPPNLKGDLKVLNGVFNWTMWHRSDATLLSPYGLSAKLTREQISKHTEALKGRNFYKEKELGITGKISNCNDRGRRYKIIQNMQKYLNIDMFGKCYDRVCGDPLDHRSCDSLTKRYKFYLAFENSNCRDYITEKYWTALERDQIPIVNWKSINASIPIPNSYINIYDFKDIKSAASYIKNVSENEQLYNSYFEWRKQYTNAVKCKTCTLCHALHDPSMPAQVISNLDGWVRDDICEKVGVFNNKVNNIRGQIFWNLGI